MAIASLMLLACSRPSAQSELEQAKASLAASAPADAVIHLKAALQQRADQPEARLMLGKLLLEAGDAAGAQIELQKALDGGQDANVVVPLLADAMLRLGQAERLVQTHGATELEQAAAQAELKAVLALALASRNKLPAATEAAQEAVRLAPGSANVRLAQARVDAAAGRWTEAMASVDRLIAEQPKRLEPLLLRANLLAAQDGDRAAVREAYQRVVELEPRHLFAQFALTQEAVRAADWPAAERGLQRLQEQHPKQLPTRFISALMDLSRGRVPEARRKAQELIKEAPDDPRVLRLAGYAAYQAGKPLEASVHLGKALGKPGSGPALRVMLARCQLQLGDPARALLTLRPALELSPVPHEAQLTAAESHLALGDHATAAALFKQAAAANPDDARARTSAVLLNSLNAPIEATDASLRQIAAADKDSTTAEMALVSLYMGRQQWLQALKAIDVLELKQGGKSPAPAMLRGRIEQQRGDLPAAKRHFEAALKRAPEHVPAVLALALLDAREGRLDAAVERLQAMVDRQQGGMQVELALLDLRAERGMAPAELVRLAQGVIKRNPGESTARIALLQSQLRAGDVKAALAAAQEAVTAFPADPAVREWLSRVHERSGDTAQAQAAAAELAKLLPNSPLPLMRQAEISLAAKDIPGARQQLRRALDISADFLPAQQLLVRLALQDGQLADARRIAATVQKQRPREDIGWLLAGDVERTARDARAAAAVYREALQRRDQPSTAVLLHGSLVAGGAQAEAQQFAAQWLERKPQDGLMRMYLADVALSARNDAQAERYLVEILRLNPQNPIALNNMAWIKLRAGKPGARADIEAALRLVPDSPPFLDTLAAVEAQEGKLEQAIATQQRAIAGDGRQAVYRFHLAQYLAKQRPEEARRELQSLLERDAKFEQADEARKLLKQLGG